MTLRIFAITVKFNLDAWFWSSYSDPDIEGQLGPRSNAVRTWFSVSPFRFTNTAIAAAEFLSPTFVA